MCHLRNMAMCDYQESVTTGQTDRQTPDKVIPMCCYASQATQTRNITDRWCEEIWKPDFSLFCQCHTTAYYRPFCLDNPLCQNHDSLGFFYT